MSKKSVRISNLQARIMQLEHVMRRVIVMIDDKEFASAGMAVVAALRDHTITKGGEIDDTSPTIAAMLDKYPQTRHLGPWVTPRSWRDLKTKMADIKASKVSADDLKGFDKVPLSGTGPGKGKSMTNDELPKWTNSPFTRVDEYPDASEQEHSVSEAADVPKGWDKIEADDKPSFLEEMGLGRKTIYLIRHQNTEEYWSNELGWCGFDEADRLYEGENTDDQLPIDGEYVNLDALRKSTLARMLVDDKFVAEFNSALQKKAGE